MGSYVKLAKRAVETEMPIMVQIQELVRGAKNAVSLAQGVVYWQPPKQALNKVKELVWETSISRYGADEGIPELREALMQKVYVSEHSACFELDDLCYGSGHWHMKGILGHSPSFPTI